MHDARGAHSVQVLLQEADQLRQRRDRGRHQRQPAEKPSHQLPVLPQDQGKSGYIGGDCGND